MTKQELIDMADARICAIMDLLDAFRQDGSPEELASETVAVLEVAAAHVAVSQGLIDSRLTNELQQLLLDRIKSAGHRAMLAEARAIREEP